MLDVKDIKEASDIIYSKTEGQWLDSSQPYVWGQSETCKYFRTESTIQVIGFYSWEDVRGEEEIKIKSDFGHRLEEEIMSETGTSSVVSSIPVMVEPLRGNTWSGLNNKDLDS